MKLKFFKFEDEIDFETNFMEEKYISTINLYFLVSTDSTQLNHV